MGMRFDFESDLDLTVSALFSRWILYARQQK
jgi:hypothetical protein